jgi:hypothetical protein
MKKMVYAVILGITSLSYAGESTNTTASEQKLGIYITNNNQPAFSVGPITQNQSSSQTSAVSQSVKQSLSNFFKATTTALSPAAIQGALTEAGKKISALCLRHAAELSLGGIAALYAWLCYETLSGASYLGKSILWSSWKRETVLSALQAMPQEDITRELLMDIQKRYTSIEKPTEFMLPLIHFLYDIDIELKMLTRYHHLGTWISKTKASYIIPFDVYRFNTAQERLARLAFIKNLFLSWAANYKIEHNKSLLLDQLRSIRPELMDY